MSLEHLQPADLCPEKHEAGSRAAGALVIVEEWHRPRQLAGGLVRTTASFLCRTLRLAREWPGPVSVLAFDASADRLSRRRRPEPDAVIEDPADLPFGLFVLNARRWADETVLATAVIDAGVVLAAGGSFGGKLPGVCGRLGVPWVRWGPAPGRWRFWSRRTDPPPAASVPRDLDPTELVHRLLPLSRLESGG